MNWKNPEQTGWILKIFPNTWNHGKKPNSFWTLKIIYKGPVSEFKLKISWVFKYRPHSRR
jgi:hypothetical protein